MVFVPVFADFTENDALTFVQTSDSSSIYSAGVFLDNAQQRKYKLILIRKLLKWFGASIKATSKTGPLRLYIITFRPNKL